MPKTDIISFAELYDYKHEIKDKTITLTNGDRIVTINYDGLSSFVDGKIKCEGNEDNFKMHIDDVILNLSGASFAYLIFRQKFVYRLLNKILLQLKLT